MNLAPIVLFVYNRPEHTCHTLNALMANELSNQSMLYIYCDGPKPGSSTDNLAAIDATRKLARETQWCKTVIVQESKTNQGLAKSIIKGINEVINKHGHAIILEDDMVTSPHFLRYMNDALENFKDNMEIGSINSYAESFLADKQFPDYFLLKGSDCWGWATWQNRWVNYSANAADLKKQLIDANKINDFEYGNHMQILNDQIAGKCDTWDAQWHAVNILHNRKGLYPKYSFIKNIGLDGSGTHCDTIEGFNDGLNLNSYTPSLPTYMAYKQLIFSKKIDDRYKKIYKAKFKAPVMESLKKLGSRIVNKIRRTIGK